MSKLDRATASHLRAWLKRNVHASDRREVEQQIRALLRDDPDLITSHSWPEMRRMAGEMAQ